MNIEDAKKRARAYIKELAGDDKDYEWKLINGMLILEDAINGDI